MTSRNTPIDARNFSVGHALVTMALRHHPGKGATQPS